MKIFTFSAALLLGCLLSACEKQAAPSATPTADARIFHVRGVVQQLSPDDPTKVVIDHEEMPGYMRAMIMPFRVKEASLLSGLKPGDVVEFDYHVEGTRSWIETLKPTGETGEVKIKAKTSEASALEEAELLAEGDLLPNYEFLDEDGKAVKLSDYRGMPVAFTFVFTRCPVPEYCPAMMRNFRTLLSELRQDANAPEKYQLLTISFDSWNDTPAVMKAWGAAYGHEAGQPWKLLSSDSCCTITRIAANVGLKFGEVKGSYQHNLRTVVLGPDGRIRRIFTDETWNTGELAAELKGFPAHALTTS